MNNSEFLFLYDAKMTNPNGNVDDENRPRMDYESKRNLVSDVRVKRYVRDYLEWQGKQIYVSQVDGKTVNAEQRVNGLLENCPYQEKDKKGKRSLDQENWLLDQLIDVRMFGATMTVKDNPVAFTGPIQLSWGYSLNPVKLMENTITTHFSSTGTQEQGTMGKDYRVVYSFLAFYGVISAKRAELTRMTEDDIKLFDEAMIKAIPLLASRSKIGQTPRLYMRAEYHDPFTMCGDWRDQLGSLPPNLKQISDVELDVSKLISKLSSVETKIKQIYLWCHPELNLVSKGKSSSFVELLPDVLREKTTQLQS
jgi:CRISPR-associated protein Csh2